MPAGPNHAPELSVCFFANRTLRLHFSLLYPMLRYSLTLFITFLVIRYVLPGVLRVLLSGFVRQQVHRAQQHTETPFGGPFGPGAGRGPVPPPSPAPGQVRVDYVPPTTKTTRPSEPKVGEYVDFEEV